MKIEIPKTYDASKVEDAIYKQWEKSGFFNPDHLPGKKKETFSVALPPPNATGVLHCGHAVMLAIQDLVIRFQRMMGKKTLWLPGTDHAAIATQTVVEKLIAKEGKTRQSLGREKFLERVNNFIKNSQNTIHEQMRKMGASCDWSRERYTLDEGLSKAVSEAFVRMYNDGLIYRGYRIVNWCPRCHSTLSDDEVEYEEQKTKFYYFKYGPVIIGTARPETKFLDKTIVVHPDDERYRYLVGKELEVEWIEGKVKANVIADSVAQQEFGSGAMTITPAHSFEDFKLAQKYHLPVVQIIGEDGNFTAAAGSFAGKNARSSRDGIVAQLQAKGLVDRIDENYVHNLSVCYRCGTPIEPIPSEQWFVDVNKKLKAQSAKLKVNGNFSLKELAIHVVRSKQIKIIPQRFEKIYFYWMENLRDWCISRQIWFGHRIPVYYCKPPHPQSLSRQGRGKDSFFIPLPLAGEGAPSVSRGAGEGECPPIVSVEKPDKCPNCGNTHLEQDPDTLDTWFSSGLWTFSTLGWPSSVRHGRTTEGKPAKTGDLKLYHPTSLMETGYDILFFWVARMIIMSNYLMKEIPFETVYLHGLVKDIHGQKMSKSHPETAIDPVDMIKKYGADAMRLSLVIGTSAGNDSRLYEEKIAGFRNFTNKLWNISRFVFTTVEKIERVKKMPKPKTIFDKWILGRFNEVAMRVTSHLEKYEFSAAGELLRKFTWNEFADWYLEVSKIPNPKSQIPNKSQTSNSKKLEIGNWKLEISHEILLYILERLLILWHPFMPFVTEEIWKNFSSELLMIQNWPECKTSKKKIDIFQIQSIIIAIRNLKAENKLANKKDLKVVVVSKKPEKNLKDSHAVIEKLAGIHSVDFSKTKPAKSISTVVGDVEIYLSISGIINRDEKQKEIADKEAYIKTLEQKLSNEEFIKKAPKQIIDNEKKKLLLQKDELHKLKDSINNLM